MRIKLQDIKVPDKMLNSRYSEVKYQTKKLDYLETGNISPILVNEDNEIVDGYITWIIYKELLNDSDYVNVIINFDKDYRSEPTLYIFGHHPGNPEEYVWRATTDLIDYLDIIGKVVICQTKFGLAPVIVDRTEVLNTPPVDGRVKKVKYTKDTYGI